MKLLKFNLSKNMLTSKFPNMNKLKLVICATFGNCFEVYDFIIYQLLATHISNNFFDKNFKYSFLLTQLVFVLTTVLSRPIGGLIFGYIADIKGRKLSLEKSILMSGLCTGMIGFIPSYENIGIFSTLLLILLRFLQGVSLGGEQGTSICFLLEHSSPKSRGFLSSFCCFGQQVGVLLAITVTSIYSWYFSASETPQQLWRIIFILSFGFGFFGYWIRKKTNETIDFLLYTYCSEEKISLLDETKLFILNNKALCVSVFFMVSFGTMMSYTVFIFGNSYLKQYADSLPIFRYIQYIMSCVVILSIPIFGFLSDRIGRKTIISHSVLIISILSIPFFQALQSAPSYTTMIVSILLSIACGAYFAVTPTIIIELLPIKFRCTNYAIFYIIPAAIVSSVSPFLSNWLIQLNPIYISYITMTVAMCCLMFFRIITEPTITYSKLNKYSYEFLKP